MQEYSHIVYTIGHSTHSAEKFTLLLKNQKIDAIADVRSSPYSRMNPQFNRLEIEAYAKRVGIHYVFLGDQLGARSNDPNCYKEGKVQYHRLAQTDIFKHGIERILNGARRFRIALMCAEKEPLECHRTILVARELVGRGIDVRHIHSDGSIETHLEAIERLLIGLGMGSVDFLCSKEDLINKAYFEQSDKIAYVRKEESNSILDDGLVYEEPIR